MTLLERRQGLPDALGAVAAQRRPDVLTQRDKENPEQSIVAKLILKELPSVLVCIRGLDVHRSPPHPHGLDILHLPKASQNQ